MRKLWFLAIVLVVLIAAAAATLWFGTPRLVDFSPQQGTADIPPSSPLKISFSRQMQSESVAEHLTIIPAVPGKYTWVGRTLLFTPDQPWKAGEKIQVVLSKGAKAKSWPGLSTQTDASWSFTIRTPRIAYLYPANQAANIYILDPLTQASHVVTELLAGIQEYDITQDGQAIYYSVQNSQNGSDVYRLSLGADLAPLSSSQILACQQVQCRAPRISPGEDYLAYERTAPAGAEQPDYPQVWLVKLNSSTSDTGERLVTASVNQELPGDHLHQTIQPDWSKNGFLSFYDTNQQAFIVVDPASRETTALPNQTGEPGNWDPKANHYIAPEIFFNTSGNPQTTPDLKPVASSHLLRYNIEEGSILDLTQGEGLEDTSPVFSPDGSLLAFARKYLDISRWTPGRQLWVMTADGKDPRQLTNAPENNHFSFSWSPTGKQLAFVRFNLDAPTEQPSIWLYDLEKNYETEIIKGGYSPRWIP